MGKGLTVKHTEPLTKIRAAEIAIKLLKLSEKKSQVKSSVGRGNKVVYVTDSTKCYFCEETRCLEKAHVIPVAIYAEAELVGERPHYLDDVMALCPTHHKCYDKYKLNSRELEHIRASLVQYDALQDLLSRLVPAGEMNPKKLKKIDDSLTIAWHWWKAYQNGNK